MSPNIILQIHISLSTCKITTSKQIRNTYYKPKSQEFKSSQLLLNTTIYFYLFESFLKDWCHDLLKAATSVPKLLNTIPGGVLVATISIVLVFCPSGFHSLKCYRCLALDCPEETVFCNEVRSFVMSQLPELYYVDTTLPQCPLSTGEDESWMMMQTNYPSSVACGAVQENEATCVLGRFQVVTKVASTDVNVTSYGTVMGCARRKLLESTVIKFKYTDPRVKNSTERQVEINKCHITASQSSAHNSVSLLHSMELEHCSKYTDMCYDRDFCVLPATSVVKPFKDQVYGVNIPMMIFIIFGVVLGLLVCGLTFLGIKYA
ncbi:unnamed protein product [Allacma fusca]|uniref:Uncharacterized protein n=1 Tax=Allacma fusca TaxID=39272 RepID=A0A8J2L2D6_9HEXA|nr:unnamed protein product [Allacma fusca]